MAIGEGEIQAELDKIRALLGSAKEIETFILGVKRALADEDPLWKVIDPTAGQKSALLTAYDGMKTAFKTLASNY